VKKHRAKEHCWKIVTREGRWVFGCRYCGTILKIERGIHWYGCMSQLVVENQNPIGGRRLSPQLCEVWSDTMVDCR